MLLRTTPPLFPLSCMTGTGSRYYLPQRPPSRLPRSQLLQFRWFKFSFWLRKFRLELLNALRRAPGSLLGLAGESCSFECCRKCTFPEWRRRQPIDASSFTVCSEFMLLHLQTNVQTLNHGVRPVAVPSKCLSMSPTSIPADPPALLCQGGWEVELSSPCRFVWMPGTSVPFCMEAIVLRCCLYFLSLSAPLVAVFSFLFQNDPAARQGIVYSTHKPATAVGRSSLSVPLGEDAVLV